MKFANYNESELTNNFGDTKGSKMMFWINDGTTETYLKNMLTKTNREAFLKN